MECCRGLLPADVTLGHDNKSREEGREGFILNQGRSNGPTQFVLRPTQKTISKQVNDKKTEKYLSIFF